MQCNHTAANHEDIVVSLSSNSKINVELYCNCQFIWGGFVVRFQNEWASIGKKTPTVNLSAIQAQKISWSPSLSRPFIPFLASQDAIEVMSVTYLLTESALALTWLMWLWWVMIPIEDFTDVIMMTLMAMMTLVTMRTLMTFLFLASQDAIEVMSVTHWVSVLIDLTHVTLVSEDTYQRLDWCDPEDSDEHDDHDEHDNHDVDDARVDHDDHDKKWK